MRVAELNGLDALESIRGPWARLVDRVPGSLPYVAPWFLMPWARSLPSAMQARSLGAWEGDELVGLAPLFERRAGPPLLGFTFRQFPVRGSAPPFDIIAAPRAEEVVGAFVDHWRRDREWDAIELRHLPGRSGSFERIRGATDRAGLRTEIGEAAEACRVTVRGGWDEFFASRPQMLRKNHRRALRRCGAIGQTEIVRYPGAVPGVEGALGLAFRVMERSWKNPGAERGSTHRFFHDLAWELDRAGRLRMKFVMIGAVPIGYLLEIEHQKRVHAFHIAYHLDYQREGPGVLLLADAIREAHERGMEAYELGSGAPYLRRWTDETEPLRTLRIITPSRARAAKSAAYLWLRDRRAARAKQRTDEVKQTRKRSGPGGDGEED